MHSFCVQKMPSKAIHVKNLLFLQKHKVMKRLITFTSFIALAIFAACANGNSKKDSDNTDKGTVTELTAEEFNKKVYDMSAEELTYLGTKPAIVDFTATWCGPCRQIAPILEKLAAEYAGQIVVYKVDVDKCDNLATAFGIQSIPAILYIPLDGEPQMTVGSRNEAQFKEEIQNILLNK